MANEAVFFVCEDQSSVPVGGAVLGGEEREEERFQVRACAHVRLGSRRSDNKRSLQSNT